MPKLFPSRKLTLRERTERNIRDRPVTLSGRAEFSLKMHMITPDEYKECRKGNMCIEGPYLVNLNTSTVTSPTGTRVKIYPDRRWNVESARLLGLECPDDIIV